MGTTKKEKLTNQLSFFQVQAEIRDIGIGYRPARSTGNKKRNYQDEEIHFFNVHYSSVSSYGIQ